MQLRAVALLRVLVMCEGGGAIFLVYCVGWLGSFLSNVISIETGFISFSEAFILTGGSYFLSELL